jgi:glyoxylase-like metal-dependent hydrolase (beta-lactamase superfamily II)
MARMSPLYPRGPFDVGNRVRALPDDGTVPHMTGWRWIHPPGHAPGHVSLFRDADRLLVAGDAVVTTKQESALAVLTQRAEIHGPPMYYTTDWVAARRSVERLDALAPAIIATGHGRPVSGEAARAALHALAQGFQWEAVPMDGRYVREPAVSDELGLVSVPPPVPDDFPKIMLGVAAVAAGVVAYRRRRHAA